RLGGELHRRQGTAAGRAGPGRQGVIKAIKGTKDILPDEVGAWHRVEQAARQLFARYGYREIRTPIFEETQLFARGIGADTDIVAKEMYTFHDLHEEKQWLTP